ncbi:MAG: hypothetical protein R3301_12060, partial [Saprospiraceae bacterium]|nr:hypothetical protein [Saprospiraceae bacterium]
SDLHHQLQDALLAYRQLQKVQEHLAELNDRLITESRHLRSLEKRLKKEEQDVIKLEKGGIKAMFLDVLGDREQQLEKERQEYLQVALKFNELGKSIELIEFEIDVLVKKLTGKDEIKRRYQELVRLREKELLETNPVVGKRLVSLSEQMDQCRIRLKDIDEADEAGRQALALVRAMEKQLRKARDWGQWDMYGGRSRGYLKHRSVDRARDLAHRVQHTLLRFRTELQDVFQNARIDVSVEMAEFDRFTDIFFDNLISDWVIQQKIKKALDNVIHTRRQVQHALNRLKQEKTVVSDKLAALNTDHERLIVEARD